MLSVLIVDDERLVRTTLQKVIDWTALGIDAVYEAEDGARGLALAEQYTPSIIISDIKMPHMNGIEFVRKVRERAMPCRVVFFSGYTDKPYLMGAIDLRVDGFIEKPLDPQQITELMQKLVALCLKDIPQTASAYFFHGDGGSLALNNAVFQLKRPALVNFGGYLRHKNAEKARELLLSLCMQMRSCEATSPDYIRNVFSRLALQIEGAAEFHGASDVQADCDHFAYAVASYTYIDQLEQKLYALMEQFFSAVLHRNYDPINLVNDYLQHHYSDSELTVNRVAQQLNFSTSYLCTLYKKKTGHTINAALTAIRMNAARELLVNPDLKLYAVANQVGYPDGKYFTKLFTKETGLSPRQFREQHHEK